MQECRVADRGKSVASQVLPWVRKDRAILLAIDSPLGWPEALGAALQSHRAGERVEYEADRMFRRRTDLVVKDVLGKTPLEVGADRIARTALWTLSFLEELRELIDEDIPLAWADWKANNLAAIEVYPAGTLRFYQRRGLAPTSGRVEQDKRSLLKNLEKRACLHWQDASRGGAENEHALDAAMCAVTALDFLARRCIEPRNEKELRLAKKEGWIWVGAAMER